MTPNIYLPYINSAFKTFCDTQWPIKAKELVRAINSLYSLSLQLETQPIDSSKLLVFDGNDCYYDSNVLLKSIGIDNGVLGKFHSNITENIITSITNWFIEQLDMYIFGIHVDSPASPDVLYTSKKPYVKQIKFQSKCL